LALKLHANVHSTANSWEFGTGETMNNLIGKLSLTIRNLSRDDGQDLVEYALVVALIAFGATATMQSLASSISLAFSNMAASLTSNIT